MDETDQYIDNMRLQRVNAALLTSSLPKHLRKCASERPLSLSFFGVHTSLPCVSMTIDRAGRLALSWSGRALQMCSAEDQRRRWTAW